MNCFENGFWGSLWSGENVEIEKIEEARQFLVSQACDAPEFGLILGSGLGELAEEIKETCIKIIKENI